MRAGIDLGTTYCAIAYVNPETGKAEVIPNGYDEPIYDTMLFNCSAYYRVLRWTRNLYHASSNLPCYSCCLLNCN